MSQLSVKIGPRFFSSAFRDYADWRWAFAREACQNSIDAPGSRKITVAVEPVPGQEQALVVWSNDGEPMDKDVLCNKLLALGESGKEFNGSVGGFGRAKEILILCHLNWQVRTGTLLAEGCGGDYTLTEGLEYFHGTETIVTIDGDHADALNRAFTKFITLSQWRGEFTLNDKTIPERLQRGRKRKELEFGSVHTNSELEGVLVVRIGGTPMYTRAIDYKRCVVVELNGKSGEVLQSSRDGLKWKPAGQLDEFVLELSVNKRSALKDTGPRTEKTKYEGYKLRGKDSTPETGTQWLSEQAPDRSPSPEDSPTFTAALVNAVQSTIVREAGELSQEQVREVVRNVPLRPEFFIKNETGMRIPAWFTPDNFSAYSKNLIWRWVHLLTGLADIYGSTRPFSVGFIFDDEGTVGECDTNGEDGCVIYISPAKTVRRDGKSPVLQCRWTMNNDGIWNLVAVAAHEFVHYLGISRHDEEFAAKLTEVMGVVLKERTRFSKVFQSPVEWPSNGE